jgi:hypothetical protein
MYVQKMFVINTTHSRCGFYKECTNPVTYELTSGTLFDKTQNLMTGMQLMKIKRIFTAVNSGGQYV